MKQPKITRIAIDGASFMWRGLLATKDTENGYTVEHEGKTIHVNSCHHGYDNVLHYFDELLKQTGIRPVDGILVFEGPASKARRLLINKGYKPSNTKAPDQYQQFEKLRDMLKDFWLGLGGQVMIQERAEGDDTLAWLGMHTEDDLIIATYDNDLTVLNGRNRHGAEIRVWINGVIGRNKYGEFPTKLVTTYKSLVGDGSDGIRGCPKFGPVAFQDFLIQYDVDGLQEVQDMLDRNSLEPLVPLLEDPSNKLLRKIYENAPQVLNSHDLVKLHPDWVDTMAYPITWHAGMVRQLRADDDHRFKQWYGKQYLVTGDKFDNAVKWALPLIAASREVALDIETSGCDESDEWLANQSKTNDAEDAGVDVYGHTLTGLSITFGDNNQYSLYFSVDHADTVNCDSEKLRQFVQQITDMGKSLIIHNMNFELVVLYNEWGARQRDNGCFGFLPNVLDTALSCAYVDENVSRGLKYRSATVLNYKQQSYKETTELRGLPEDLPRGGRLIAEIEPEYEVEYVGTGQFEPIFDKESGAYLGDGPELTRMQLKVGEDGEPVVKTPAMQVRRYRMNELTARHVTAYGCDDTICTIAHHNYNRLRCQLEHQWHVYLEVEIDAAYQHAKNFIDGMPISLEKMRELSAADDKTYDESWATVRQYLISQGWAGTNPPTYTADIEPAQVKEAFQIVTGRVLDTLMRTPSKLVAHIRHAEGEELFAGLLEECYAGNPAPLQKYVRSKFKGEPQFNYGSSTQKGKLLYEVMGLPIRLRNKPTDAMWQAGIREGNPQANVDAINYALRDCTPEQQPVLEAMKLMGMVQTRRTLYYNKYPYFPHWKDGKVRSQHNQSSTNTRRASSSRPNVQQMPKHAKIEGQDARFREVVVPHKPGAVVVSIDFKAQELRIMADQSKDPVMLSMYIGDNLRDQHHLTGSAIAQKRDPLGGWSYETFAAALDNKGHSSFKFVKECRGLGKKLNFTAEYGAMAQKVALTLMISVEEAQQYLDAREAMFTVAGQWKLDTVEEAKTTGIVRTMMGAVRHLRDAVTSSDRRVSSKAERQAVNFKIQSSSAEQTKLAEGKMWKSGLFFRYDAVCYGPIHDEIVASVMIKDLYDFLPEMHGAMAAPYGGMVVPIEASISFGPDFYRQIEIGSYPTREAIDAGLKELDKMMNPELEAA